MERVVLAYTTDLHGFLVGDSYFQTGGSRHGLLYLSERIRQLRQRNREFIFFDNGDLFSGSLLSLRFVEDRRFKNPVISLMNDLGCSFSVIGNHEFDFGRGYLDKLIRESNFPWLSANIIKKSGVSFTGGCYFIHKTGQGRELAFIGLTTPETSKLINKEDQKDINFEGLNCSLELVLAELRERGVDFVAVVYHGGYDRGLNYWLGTRDERELSSQIAADFPEIDLLVTGHTHGCIADREINGVHTIQAGCNGFFLGEIELQFKGGRCDISSRISGVSSDEPDKVLLVKYKPYLDSTKKWLEQVVARSNFDYVPCCKSDLFLEPSYLSSLIHKIIQEQSLCDISVASLWGVEGWGKGEVKRKSLVNVMPDNDLYILSMFGKDIKLALERTAECFSFDRRGRSCISTKYYEYDIWAGIEYKIDIANDVGSRIVKLKYKGEDVVTTKRYNVAVYHFRASGSLGYDMFSQYRAVWQSKNTVRDYLFSYLKRYPLLLDVKKLANFKVVRNDKEISNPKFV